MIEHMASSSGAIIRNTATLPPYDTATSFSTSAISSPSPRIATINVSTARLGARSRRRWTWALVASAAVSPSRLEGGGSPVSPPSIIAPAPPGTGAENTRTTTSSPALADVWREIQGSRGWEGLVDPLDPLLRDEIVRYGEFVDVCYKAFDLDPASDRYLSCKYGRRTVLYETGLQSSGYEVTKYIYATPDITTATNGNDAPRRHRCCSRWIGYVAVSTDKEAICRMGRRDILVALRGTVTDSEWAANFMSSLVPAGFNPLDPREDVRAVSGFLGLYASVDGACRFGQGSCREQLLSEVSRLMKIYDGEELSVTVAGHSMGSSLAILFAYDIAELGLNANGAPITVYSFGGPRVGSVAFKDRCEELGVRVLRVANANDPVTKLPGVFFNENFVGQFLLGGKVPSAWSRSYSSSLYAHVGVELPLSFFGPGDPAAVHDLGHYLQMLRCTDEKKSAADANVSTHLITKVLSLFLRAKKMDSPAPWQKECC